MFLPWYCILIVPFLFTVILSYLLLSFNTFPHYKHICLLYLRYLFLPFLWSWFIAYILLTDSVSSILFLITLHQVYLTFSVFVSTKVLLLFMNPFLTHYSFTAISFYKRSYYLLLVKSTAFLLGRQVSPCTPDPACLWVSLICSASFRLQQVSADSRFISNTNTQVLVRPLVPGMGLIPTRFWYSAAVSLNSVASAYVVVSSLVVSCSRLGDVRVDCVPSELAATFLSLRSIYLTPNPNPVH